MKTLQTLIPLLLNCLFRLAAYEAELRLKRLRMWAFADCEKDARIVFLEDQNRKFRDENETQRALLCHQPKCHYSIRQRLFVLRFIELYRIPRSKITEQFGIARSSLYRWLHQAQDAVRKPTEPFNKTPIKLVQLVWRIIESNPTWGRHRVAMQAWLLKVFVSPSTVRNILKQPFPRNPKPVSSTTIDQPAAVPRRISAQYQNHVWSADLTMVLRWGLWPTHLLIVIDHFSRKLLAAIPLEGPNAGWIVDAMEVTFKKWGSPRHLITDQGLVFKSKSFGDLLKFWNVKHRFGAVGKHGSIAVTERLIRTLKYEWLKRIPLLRGIGHLQEACDAFAEWYNCWRPHTRLKGSTPEVAYSALEWKKPDHDAKTVPRNIQTKLFRETGVVGFKIAA